jgi:acyl-CoA thioesterase YciA
MDVANSLPTDPANGVTARGTLTLQTLAMPRDANPNGDIFGGWLVSQMDLAGAIMARRVAGGRVTTVAIDRMSFHLPVLVGDLVSCYALVTSQGRSSMHIAIEVWAGREDLDGMRRVTEANFVFVALDTNGRPRPLKP